MLASERINDDDKLNLIRCVCLLVGGLATRSPYPRHSSAGVHLLSSALFLIALTPSVRGSVCVQTERKTDGGWRTTTTSASALFCIRRGLFFRSLAVSLQPLCCLSAFNR